MRGLRAVTFPCRPLRGGEKVLIRLADHAVPYLLKRGSEFGPCLFVEEIVFFNYGIDLGSMSTD